MDYYQKKKILHIGATLQGIVQTIKSNKDESTIHVPKLVVVGSQSSGKSSLLNGILSFDLLPTGKNMSDTNTITYGINTLKYNTYSRIWGL